jgi:multimeric flavodoxin WrbA
LGICGSPRRGGNTETLVDEVLRGAQQAGAAVEKVLLSELDIAPCDACNACETTGDCVYDDDMPPLWDKMARSQVWVLGTPVYWWGPSAQFKLFLDRWYSKIFLPADRAVFKERKIVLVIPMGDPHPATARHTVGMLNDALSYTQSRIIATVLAAGVNDPGEVRRHTAVMTAAREAGREAVRACS